MSAVGNGGKVRLAMGAASPAAAKDERSSARLAFVNSTHKLVVKKVLGPFLEAVAPEVLSRFDSPELKTRPNAKKGTQEYIACTLTSDYELSVILVDGDPMVLSVYLIVRNPYSEKQSVILDSASSENLDGAFLTENSKKTAIKTAKKVVENVRNQVRGDLPGLKVSLESAQGQVRFLTSILKVFQQESKK